MAVTKEIAERQMRGEIAPQPIKHSAEWCRNNPCQSSADIERMHTAIMEALRLFRTGEAADKAEAMAWLFNASQI